MPRYDRIEWDDGNLGHATEDASVAEIEEIIVDATRAIPHNKHHDRVLFRGRTFGGRRLVIVAQVVRDGVRPITAWEDK